MFALQENIVGELINISDAEPKLHLEASENKRLLFFF